jgi:quinoprotein glucose dehydrogenase
MFVAHVVSAQREDAAHSAAADWPTYNRDLAGTRYSPLTQINTGNVATLVQQWSYRLRPEPGRSVPAIDKPASSFEIFQQVTPIVVNGVMYLPSGNRVVALDPETGKEIWRYELPEGLASFRGLAYWPGDPSTTLGGAGGLPARIFFTSLRKLIALRADTGALARDFADGGVLDLEIPYAGVPVIYRKRRADGIELLRARRAPHRPAPDDEQGEKGEVHAYDARTGKKVWDFHTIPRPANRSRHVGQRQLEGSHRQQRLVVHADGRRAARDRLPAGQRSGHELLRRRSSRRQPVQQLDGRPRRTDRQMKWHFQNIRHEIWDYNLPPAPGLIDIKKDGKTIPRARAGRQVGLSCSS